MRRARTALAQLDSRRLDDFELVALMIDSIELADRCHVVALGICLDGTKVCSRCGKNPPRTRPQ
jgi:hypothetical protein